MHCSDNCEPALGLSCTSKKTAGAQESHMLSVPISAPFSEINSPSGSPLPETACHLLTHFHPLFHVPCLNQELGFEPTCICEQGLRRKMELIHVMIDSIIDGVYNKSILQMRKPRQ